LLAHKQTGQGENIQCTGTRNYGYLLFSIPTFFQWRQITVWRYEAGSAYRMQPYIRSNARAVDRSLATIFDFRRSARSLYAGVRSARRPHLAAISPNILKIAKTRDGHPFTVSFALQKPPPRASHVVYARDGAGNSRSRCAFASRILGSTDLGSTAIKCHFGFKNKKDHLSNPSYRAER